MRMEVPRGNGKERELANLGLSCRSAEMPDQSFNERPPW